VLKKMIVAAALIPAAGAAQAQAPEGFRVEVLAGWDGHGVGTGDLDVPGLDLDSNGVVFGIGAGYDFALAPGLSLGVDVEASETTAEFELSQAGENVRLQYGRDLYAGARVTVAATDKLNFYGKVGYTNARVEFDTNVADAAISQLSGNLDGWRLGAGGQWSLTNALYLGAEYRYSNYDGPFDRNQLVGSIGFRF